MGLEVWFDENELRGGDAWDASIRKQIRECALFVPIISANTNARSEGYFRLEWKLAVDRSHLMADDQPFLLPVAIDDTVEAPARVPDRFRELQWSRPFSAETPKAFAERALRLASHAAPSASPAPAARPVPASPGDAPSIAVLPFVNMSRDEENEYFSDGLSEELMNVLAKIPELKVTGRTSSFAFKGKKEDLRDIGQKLGVATLLEGSVRKAGNRVRITAQLIKVSDGFHLWSETYDRVLDDIFAVQDDIARSVSQALHVTLLGGARSAPKAGAEVFPLVLQANHLTGQNSGPALERAVALYREVIAKSPDNAPAWAGRSLARLYQGGYGHAPLAECIQEARAAADRALELDDRLAAAHDAKGVILASYDFRFREGVEEVRKAVSLAPGASGPMITLSMYEGALGSMSEALRLARRAQEIDPLSADTHANRGRVEVWARNWEAASEAYQRSLELSPNAARTYSSLGMIYLHRGMGEKAIETIMKEVSPGYRYFTLAVAYHELGRKKESDEAMARVLEESEDWGTQFASAHAARGEIDQAFHC